MNISTRRQILRFIVYSFAVVGFAAFIYTIFSPLFTAKVIPTVSAQTDPFLDRRIGQIEQRFYAIESRINRLEQDSRVSTITPQFPNTQNNTQIELLSSQVDTLRLRVQELECAAAKLDERTLPENARRPRSAAQTGEITDPCRRNVNERLTLSARP